MTVERLDEGAQWLPCFWSTALINDFTVQPRSWGRKGRIVLG